MSSKFKRFVPKKGMKRYFVSSSILPALTKKSMVRRHSLTMLATYQEYFVNLRGSVIFGHVDYREDYSLPKSANTYL